ncbi:MAG: hypothetical protein ACK4JD_12615 [Thermoflexales bacterium]
MYQYRYFLDAQGRACAPGYTAAAKGIPFAEYRPPEAATEVDFATWREAILQAQIARDLLPAIEALGVNVVINAGNDLPKVLLDELAKEEAV